MERNQAEVLAQEIARRPHPERTKPADPRKLRGVPVCAEGVGSVSPGTQPERAAVRKLVNLDRYAALAAVSELVDLVAAQEADLIGNGWGAPDPDRLLAA